PWSRTRFVGLCYRPAAPVRTFCAATCRWRGCPTDGPSCSGGGRASRHAPLFGLDPRPPPQGGQSVIPRSRCAALKTSCLPAFGWRRLTVWSPLLPSKRNKSSRAGTPTFQPTCSTEPQSRSSFLVTTPRFRQAFFGVESPPTLSLFLARLRL